MSLTDRSDNLKLPQPISLPQASDYGANPRRSRQYNQPTINSDCLLGNA